MGRGYHSTNLFLPAKHTVDNLLLVMCARLDYLPTNWQSEGWIQVGFRDLDSGARFFCRFSY